MSQYVVLNTPAPSFDTEDFTGNPVNLEKYHGTKNVVLVFNRSFG